MKGVFYFYSVCIGLCIAIILLLAIQLSFVESLRLVGSFALILFIPGFVWSWLIWKIAEISELERIGYSIALSMVSTPLFMLVLNRLGVSITTFSSLLTTVALIFIGLCIMFIRHMHLKSIKSKKIYE